MSVTGVGVVEVVLLIAALVLIVAGAIVGWDRYRPGRHGPNPHAHPTSEVFIDPETGGRMRVWFDPATGARDYRPD